MKGKEISKHAIVFASLWIIFHSILKAVFPFFDREYGLSMTEIIGSAVSLVVIWTPIYRSVWLDKQLGIDKKDRCECGREE